MYSNLDGINNKHNDHDLSVLVACKKFEESQRKTTRMVKVLHVNADHEKSQ